MTIARAIAPLLLLMLLFSGCSDSAPPRPPILSDAILPLQIDGTTIFVPVAWAQADRSWPNGVQASNSGYGAFETYLGALARADEYDHPRPKDGIYRASSANQSAGWDENKPDSFFELSFTFEHPKPPNRFGMRHWQKNGKFSFDMLSMRYRASYEKPMPHLTLLSGLKPDDGQDLGNGWRAVMREYGNRKVWFRFDAVDWRAHGGALPRRLAAGSSRDGPLWDHHVTLSPSGWSLDFSTQRLPLSRWRKRHEVSEALYLWLQTRPAKRDSGKRFKWWEDIADRPTH